MPDRQCSYPSHQKESRHDLLFLPSDHPLPGCLVAIDSEGRILSHWNPSSRSTSKPFGKMRCQIFSTITDLQPQASSRCRQTVRGFLHLTLGVFLVKEAAGSWYFNLFLLFLLSPPRTKTISSLLNLGFFLFNLYCSYLLCCLVVMLFELVLCVCIIIILFS